MKIKFIEENNSINNTQARDILGFSKYKNVKLFNSLLEKGYIKKVGQSSGTKYILEK